MYDGTAEFVLYSLKFKYSIEELGWMYYKTKFCFQNIDLKDDH